MIVTSYTHPPYKEKLQYILAHQSRWDQSLIVRGVEGAIQLPLDRRAPFVTMTKDQVTETGFFRPEQVNQELQKWEDPPVDPRAVHQASIAALKGAHNICRQALVYQTSLILKAFSLMPLSTAITTVTAVIDKKKSISSLGKRYAWVG